MIGTSRFGQSRFGNCGDYFTPLTPGLDILLEAQVRDLYFSLSERQPDGILLPVRVTVFNTADRTFIKVLNQRTVILRVYGSYV